MLPKSIAGELCRILTADGLELHGFFCPGQKPSAKRPRARRAKRIGVLHVHGWQGNFYENRFIYAAAASYSGRGLGFLAMNNRGHDYIADILRPRGEAKAEQQESSKQQRGGETGVWADYVQLGGVYERLADSIPDIRAGLAFLAKRGYGRFILQGHSHGAVKAAHYLATTQDRRIAGLVLLSPSDDLAWGRKLLGDRFSAVLRRATALVRAGRERELLPAGAFPYPVSAGTFLDSFGPDAMPAMFNLSRTDRSEFPELAAIRVPTLAVVGTVEEAFVLEPADYLDRMRQAMVQAATFTGHVVNGAPHNYLRFEQQLAAVLEAWLDGLGLRRAGQMASR